MPEWWIGRKHSEETKKKMSEARRGRKNSFYGKKHSDKTREKLSAVLRKQFSSGVRKSPTDGTKRSDATKRKISETRIRLGIAKGSNNPRWIDGKSRTNKDLRRNEMETTKYKEWRKSVFEKDNYTCVKCKQHGGDLQADHIKPWAYFPKLRYRLSNGRTLCVKCHRLTFKLIWSKKNVKA